MKRDSRIKRERNLVEKQKSLRKKKRTIVQKKKLIDAPCESNIRAVVKENVSSENVHSAGRL